MLAFHRFLLGLYGVAFVATGLLMLVGTGIENLNGLPLGPLTAMKAGFALLNVLAGLFFLRGPRMPDFLRSPSSRLHPLAIFLLLSLICGGMGGLSLILHGIVGDVPGQDLFFAPIAPALLTFLIAGPLGTAIAFGAIMANPTGRVGREQAQRAAFEVAAGPDDALTRLMGLLGLLILMALCVLAAISGAYVMGFLPETSPIPLVGDSRGEGKLAIAALILPLVTLIPARKIHGVSLRPRSVREALLRPVLLLIATGPALWFSQGMIPDLLPAPWDQIHALRFHIVGGGLIATCVLGLLVAMRGPGREVSAAARTPVEPVAQTDRRGSKLTTAAAPTPRAPAEVPDIGWLMKTYRVADWLLLRLFGAMLLFMAFMIYNIQEWELHKIGGMLYGIKPSTVMYVYAAWGAMLMLPAILPGFISRPQTVLGGAGKAGILVGLAILLLPGIDAAIDLYAPGDYRGSLHASVPGLFKGVAGLAIFSAMAIALFRNLSRTAPRVLDGLGRPTRQFSAEDLRALRAARMQG